MAAMRPEREKPHFGVESSKRSPEKNPVWSEKEQTWKWKIPA